MRAFEGSVLQEGSRFMLDGLWLTDDSAMFRFCLTDCAVQIDLPPARVVLSRSLGAHCGAKMPANPRFGPER